ncbi:MAG TPA: ribonuclease Z [Saprospiraceae bacterium]|nr:ribonuclease Z [Saprospiraceae bacterium]
MRFELRLLGTASAQPSLGRFTTCHHLNIQEQHFLIDCGEGAQMRMEQYKVKRSKINHIFISHLHGDHFFGLWGLLTSYTLNNRTAALHLYSPPGLKEVLLPALSIGGAELSFPLHFTEVDPEAHRCVYDNNQLSVHTIPLRHRIPACGYLFREKQRPRNMIGAKIQQYDLSIPQIKAAKAGEDIPLEDGRLVPNHELTEAALPPRAYAFCSDTRYTETIIPYIKGVDLLYHESTFCADNLHRAEVTMHSTAAEAARIAQAAGVGKLILGHFSTRYEDTRVFETEARSIFAEAYAGEDGLVIEL